MPCCRVLSSYGHCPWLSCMEKTEDDCGIWDEIECCPLYPAQLLHVVFEMRAGTKESPSRHQAMIFPSIMMRDHFTSLCCGKEEIKACNHLKDFLQVPPPPGQENKHSGTDGFYLHTGLLPLLHTLKINSLEKVDPVQINIVIKKLSNKLSKQTFTWKELCVMANCCYRQPVCPLY